MMIIKVDGFNWKGVFSQLKSSFLILLEKKIDVCGTTNF